MRTAVHQREPEVVEVRRLLGSDRDGLAVFHLRPMPVTAPQVHHPACLVAHRGPRRQLRHPVGFLPRQPDIAETQGGGLNGHVRGGRVGLDAARGERGIERLVVAVACVRAPGQYEVALHRFRFECNRPFRGALGVPLTADADVRQREVHQRVVVGRIARAQR